MIIEQTVNNADKLINLCHLHPRTPDEDFSILLEAALMYDRRVAATLGEEDSMDEGQLWIDIKNGKQFDYPRLLFVITGITHSAIFC